MADISRIPEGSRVKVSSDSMNASLYLEPPLGTTSYTVDELAAFLRKQGVTSGIIYTELEKMTLNNTYYVDHEVARGTYPQEGRPGYYDLFFDENTKRKPLIRSDGSVDYQSMSEIQNVCIGDKLAQYHPAVQGKAGMDVRGRTLKQRPCKELPALKGIGISYDEKTGIYTAAKEGRVEYNKGSHMLNVRDVYEFKGDLDLVTGKIDFRGDVIIKGNVLSGTYVRASRTITVEGSVEAAILVAEGDIIIKKGMMGGQKARISTNGNVYANFIEFTQIQARGRVEANIIMNCEIDAGEDIVVSGKKGAIIGGRTYAVGCINCTFAGNAAGAKTLISVGIPGNTRERHKLLTVKYENAKKGIAATEAEIIKVSDSRIVSERKEVRDARISQLKRRLKRDERLMEHVKKELDSLKGIMGVGSHASISVTNTTFTGTTVKIDEMEKKIDRDYKNTEFSRDKDSGDIVVNAG